MRERTDQDSDLVPANAPERRRPRVILVASASLGVLLLVGGAYELGRRNAASAAAVEAEPASQANLPVRIPAGVELDASEAAAIGLKTVVVEMRAIARVTKLTGAIQVPPDSREFIGSRVEGKIASVAVNTGDLVRAGQVLATVQSPEFETLQSEFLRAAAELPVAEAAAERQKKLVAIAAIAEKDAQAAAAQYDAKKSEIAGLKERLEIFGVSAAAIAELQRTHELIRALPVLAHLTGTVVTRNAVAGSPVTTDAPIFEIDNLSTVWVEGDVFEAQLPGIAPGLAAAVGVPAYPGKVFDGRVQTIIPSVDPEKRTARVRVVLPNPGGLLKPGMFATLTITVGSEPAGVVVPVEALIEQSGSTFVFVKNGSQFVKQDVVVAARDARYAQISHGLIPKDLVVTDGKMQLYTKSLYQ